MSIVSVVILTYNRPEFLPGAIRSALAQEYPDLEVIVIDDGSKTDYAEETVAEFPDNVRFVSHETNRGVPAARNTGIAHSNGEYIAFLDDDDRWLEGKTRKQVAALDRNPAAGLATCSIVVGTTDGQIKRCDPLNPPEGDLSADICLGNPIGGPSRVLIRRECFDDVGLFDESLSTTDDRDFFLRVCQNWEVAAVPEHLLYRTVHGENLSSDIDAKARDRMTIYRKHEELIQRHHEWEDVLQEYHENLGRAYLETAEFSTARDHLKTALSYGLTLRGGALFAVSYTSPWFFRCILDLRHALQRYTNCPRKSVGGVSYPDFQADI